ncbi:PLP-dependent aminotransferase family protein [Azospirillum sp. TSO35-2]|uniref:aminotransferase-like domain-containing protein n=1 Tax=Azospirillum sp. TSO35-2 TaxID=716796 RepID=UPI000D61074E|nr:PLP-dependent aminotransferase family protein [Azospirillum sp. TSO35-2]PWC36097.1 GntR family transcriptional regulator [Azospirillum sp. TSO35-2]
MQSDSSVWQPDLSNRDKPVYLAIADAIADDVRNGRLAVGQRLPPQRTLADRLGVDLTTVSRAYTEARQRGLLDARVGQGTFIRAQSAPPPRPAGSEAPPTVPASMALVDMTMNQPPLPDAPELMERVRQTMAQAVLQTDLRSILRYPEAGAGAADRAAGARWLGRRLADVPVERVVVCPGTQSALLSLLTMLAQPGDTVCAEALTYPGFKAIARQLGLQVAGVAMDGQGLDPEALRAAFAAHAPKALYCTPTLHNPTTATLPPDRRHAVAALAREYGVPIIEDDIYGVLPDSSPPPIAALAPDMTFYVAGLAKCVAPGLRITYVAAPDTRQAMRLTGAQRATTLGTPPLPAAIATQWIGDGTAELLLASIHGEAVARQRMARDTLPAANVAAHPEGFHLWLRLPTAWTRGEFATHLRSRGIAAVVSDAFTTTATAPEALRICLGAPADRSGTQRVLDILADALDQIPAMAGVVI